MQVKVIGKTSFVSKKTQKPCYMIHGVKNAPIANDRGIGYETVQQFCSQGMYDKVTVDMDVNILYDSRGYVEDIVPVK